MAGSWPFVAPTVGISMPGWFHSAGRWRIGGIRKYMNMKRFGPRRESWGFGGVSLQNLGCGGGNLAKLLIIAKHIEEATMDGILSNSGWVIGVFIFVYIGSTIWAAQKGGNTHNSERQANTDAEMVSPHQLRWHVTHMRDDVAIITFILNFIAMALTIIAVLLVIIATRVGT